ncbi:hypothetical protein ACSSWA_03475 [Melioribacter sp. Ez-97]|uniref:hypothetical protein n=1 Tax=Melioribacter sp. Ez-97 TaxID=3423434 RepID=UPI003ED8B162
MEEKIALRLDKITLIEFYIKNDLSLNKIIKENINFDVKIGLGLEEKNNIIHISTFIKILKTKKNDKDKLCELITQISYQVEELKKFINPDDKEIKLPDILVHTLISISLSTTRGILSEKTRGTILEDIYLPILDPKKFIKQNKEIVL